jgi:predicted nucleic acid-binding protein
VILVDSNVILDVLTADPTWSRWSGDALATATTSDRLAINPIVYSEVSVRFSRREELDEVLGDHFLHIGLPYEAAFLAGKLFVEYRRRGGVRTAPLPDFFIGAHAAVTGMPLLTRNGADYRRRLPGLTLIAPD